MNPRGARVIEIELMLKLNSTLGHRLSLLWVSRQLPRRRRARVGIVLLTLGFVINNTGCGGPAAKFDSDARRRGFAREEADLVHYRKGALVDGSPIHLYLDGDGRPATRAGRITRDPTSRNRIVLALMDADPEPSILIGRPCYYRQTNDCDAAAWTVGRYSADVVAALAQDINATIAAYPHSPITIIGYSGGGTLAMLVAPSLTRIDTVVTIAANLDTSAWTAHHGYAPLGDSLNPAEQPPLAPSIRQFHYFGAEDVNVPATLMRHVADRQTEAVVEVVSGHGHTCCWPDFWSSKVAELESGRAAWPR